MQVVINIPTELYERLMESNADDFDGFIEGELVRFIQNGTPLPEGYGRLGDLDALEKLCIEHNIANSAYDNSPMIEQGHYSDGDCIWKPLFDFAPTIIEADTESEG